MITRLLVANRAEIASRVFRTCRELGIDTVAVHSDADAALPYVREADAAVRLPGTSPADTYLRVDLVVDAALRSGADAVHPGYGFLSENADLSRAVVAAGLTWVGPSPASIEAMGSKVRAKELMRAAGVPVLTAPEHPTAEDLPLLVKASAGGGGRGMRVVGDLEVLADEVATARAEAAAAFGDGTVFLEPYVERGRHLEVQVVGRPGGAVSVYGERDCSLQRRHQKVVEESPAPELPEATRAALHAAATAAAQATGYLGAGTVEFLYDPAADRFWFLEMNTRLQVEHPVTELTHRVDLVAEQIAVAEGKDGSSAVGGPRGHAIEARLYAEDPAAGYRPQSGLLTTFEIPVEGGIRVDSGYESGSEVSTFYDAMLAKVVAWAESRDEAARKLAGVLSRARIHGVRTNRDQLVAALRHPDFLAGRVSTAFFTDHPPSSVRPSGDHAVAAALALAERDRADRAVQQRVPVAWRNVVSQPQRTVLSTGPDDDPVTVQWYGGRAGYAVHGLVVRSASPTRVVVERDGVATAYDVAVRGDRLDVDAASGHVALRLVPRFADPVAMVASGSLTAPMPGTVLAVPVGQGQRVEPGQPIVVLEAMKMQHTVTTPTSGRITSLSVQPGDQVAAGTILAVVSPDPADEGDESR